MGVCKWAAPTFLREWRANEWVSQMCHVGDLANDVSAGTLHHRIVWAIPSLIDHSARRPSFQSCLQLVKVLKLQSKMPRSIH